MQSVTGSTEPQTARRSDRGRDLGDQDRETIEPEAEVVFLGRPIAPVRSLTPRRVASSVSAAAHSPQETTGAI